MLMVILPDKGGRTHQGVKPSNLESSLAWEESRR